MTRVIDRDKGAKALKARIKGMKAQRLTVGIHSDVGGNGTETPGVSLLEVATANEFGTEEIPERSFIRGYVDEKERVIPKILKLEAEKVIKGDPPAEALSRAGVFIRAGIQARIAQGIDPENSPATIARKGSSTPLIDTGQLRASIDLKVGKA